MANAECAVHTLTMEKIDNLRTDVNKLTDKVGVLDSTMATFKERVDNTKSLVWLIVATFITSAVGVLVSLFK